MTDVERAELVRLTKRAKVNRVLAFRTRLVLACADYVSDTAVARRYRTTNATVGKWRMRFITRRLEGLYDEPRVGAPRTVSDAAVEAVIVKTLETTPAGATHWSTRTMASDLDVHVVLDNLSAHKAPPVHRWLLRHPRFQLHFTPTYGSWLNLVERFFGLLTERALKRGSHTSVHHLRDAILAYVAAHNEASKPFRWPKTADEILDKMRRFGLRTLQVHGS